MAISVTRSQPNGTIMGDSGAQLVPPPSTKHQMMTFLVEEWCRIPPVGFQTLVESMPRCFEAVLPRSGPNAPLRHVMLVLTLFWHLPVHVYTQYHPWKRASAE